MNKIYLSIGIICLVLITFVIGDYFKLFGVEQVEKFDFAELNFKTVDEGSGMRVTDVKTRCFQKRNTNACAQRDSGEVGIVSINIPVQKNVTQSILFEHDVKLIETSDPKLHIMFIHANYANPVETVYIDELLELADQQMVVVMPKSIRASN